MATTDYTITDADIGQTIGVPDGFITNLSMVTPPSVYEIPSFNFGRWTSGFFTLRDRGWRRDGFSFAPGSCSPFQPRAGGGPLDMIVNGAGAISAI